MTAIQPLDTTAEQATWPATLALRFARSDRGTRLVHAAHRGPLRVQRPFYPEGAGCAHVYLLHPPGGLVSGDSLDIEVEVAAESAVLLTTPGAGRIYRARAQTSRQSQRVCLRIAAGAVLEWLPLETIVFDGANVSLELQVELQGDAAFCGWEVVCLGRQAGAQPFLCGHLQQLWRVQRDGRPLMRERLLFGAQETLVQAPWGLGGAPVYGTLLAILPALAEAWVAPLRALIEAEDASAEMAVTLVRGMLLVRYRGHSGERARQLLRQVWELLRPALNGRVACAPRIWNT